MTKYDTIAKTFKPTDGVLLIVTGVDNKFDVHLLQAGTITEAQVERHLPVLYHEIMRQRLQHAQFPAGPHRQKSPPHSTIAEETEEDME